MGICGYAGRLVPKGRALHAAYRGNLYVNRADFFALENSLRIFAVRFMEE